MLLRFGNGKVREAKKETRYILRLPCALQHLENIFTSFRKPVSAKIDGLPNNSNSEAELAPGSLDSTLRVGDNLRRQAQFYVTILKDNGILDQSAQLHGIMYKQNNI